MFKILQWMLRLHRRKCINILSILTKITLLSKCDKEKGLFLSSRLSFCLSYFTSLFLSLFIYSMLMTRSMVWSMNTSLQSSFSFFFWQVFLHADNEGWLKCRNSTNLNSHLAQDPEIGLWALLQSPTAADRVNTSDYGQSQILVIMVNLNFWIDTNQLKNHNWAKLGK